MANGKLHDHPITDMVHYGLHPFPAEIEELIRNVAALNPDIVSELEWAPLDWEAGRFLDEARRLLQGLLEHHGDPAACRRLIAEYHDACRP